MKGTRNRELESVQPSDVEKDKICLERKLIKLCKETLRLRQDYQKRRLNETEDNGKGENADSALY